MTISKTISGGPPPTVANAAKPAGVRFEVLDASRGIGAFLVILGHYNAELWAHRPTFITHSSGYLVVDVFFLLSGFVLAHAFFEKSDFNFWEFTKKRIFRLWPLHMATLIGFTLLMILAGDPINKKGFVLNTVLLHNIGIGDWRVVEFNYPSWSLSVELVSNIIVGAMLLAIPSKRVSSILLAAISIASATILFLTVDHLDQQTRNVYGVFNTGLLRGFITFPLGILAYRLFTAKRHWFESTSPAYTVFVGLLVVVFFTTLCIPGRAKTDFIYFPLYAVVIMVMASPGPFWTRHLGRFRFLGTISFALYMVHMLVLKVMEEVPFWPHDYYAGMVVVLALSVICAVVAHYAIEKPAYDWMTQAFSRRKNKPAALQEAHAAQKSSTF